MIKCIELMIAGWDSGCSRSRLWYWVLLSRRVKASMGEPAITVALEGRQPALSEVSVSELVKASVYATSQSAASQPRGHTNNMMHERMRTKRGCSDLKT